MAGRRNGSPQLLAVVYRVVRVPHRVLRGGIETDEMRGEVERELIPYSWGRFAPSPGCYIKRKEALAAAAALGSEVTRQVDQRAEAARQTDEKRACRRQGSTVNHRERNRRMQQQQRDHQAALREQRRQEGAKTP